MSNGNTTPKEYLMEDQAEGKRLELKTDRKAVIRQAEWAGIGPGMRVLDVGCGTGITTSALAELVGPTGHVTGLDFSVERLAEARERFATSHVDFVCHDITETYKSSLPYDAVWSRFFLEYFRNNQQEVISNGIFSLRPGGIACFADLDNNSLGHGGISDRLQETLKDIAQQLEQNFNFDPYAGRRLYGHLFDLGFKNLSVTAEMHHLVYGLTDEKEQYNWLQKLEIAAQKSGCDFSQYGGDFNSFREEFEGFLKDPRRFTYTPIIIARGNKP